MKFFLTLTDESSIVLDRYLVVTSVEELYIEEPDFYAGDLPERIRAEIAVAIKRKDGTE